MSLLFHVFDVGHGDSFILKTPGNKVCIIDCHKYNYSVPIIDYLKIKQISEIELICLTHPHHDHFSGMNDLIDYCVNNNIAIKNFYLTGISPKQIKFRAYNKDECNDFTLFFKRVLNLAKANKINYKRCEADSILLEEDQCSIRALCPDARTIDNINLNTFNYGDTYLNECLNDLSIVLQIDVYNKRLLLLSDSPLRMQDIIIKKYFQLSNRKTVSIFKISHHGSFKYLNQKLIQTTKSNGNCTALISAGCCYNLPDINTVKKLSSLNIPSYSTNFWDYSDTNDKCDDNEYFDFQILEALKNLTDEVKELPKIMPYHGGITVEIDSAGINIKTEINRDPLIIK